ncbi:MAG TPA: FKBP-type peptidyl-prolyl cis-trans isomerase [Opitutaceae bacterium]
MSPLRLIAATCALIAAPLVLHAQREKLPPDDYDIVMKKWPQAQISNTGIRYIIEKQGAGPLLMPGDMVMVHYTGKLLNGKIFDQNHDEKKPFTFRVDRGEVIVAWDQILQSMRPGDKWLLIIPPELAYGRRGEPPVIPSYATLVFEVEIVGVKKDS